MTAGLGILAKSVNPDQKALLKTRFDKQRQAAKWLPSERVSQCLSKPSPMADHVAVVRSESSASFRNLIVCGSVWHCPCCAAKISEFRRSELTEAIATGKEIGSSVLMLTLTAPHSRQDSCSDLVQKMGDARKLFTNRKIFKGFAAAVGLFGSVRALEVTYGSNGWHVHFHVLLFIKAGCEDIARAWKDKLLNSWISCTDKVGLVGTNEHGLDLQDGNCAAQYAGKWGLEHELTKGHIKKSSGGFSPFDLLSADPELPSNCSFLFQEYAAAFKGRRQLVWSKGLRDLLLSTPEISDEEIAEIEEDGKIVLRVTLPDWKLICKRNLRSDLLCSVLDGEDSVASFFTQLRFSHPPP